MRFRVALVTETSKKFLNQTKLCLYSLRKNAGGLSNVPVTLITNSEPLSLAEQLFFKDHFSPIEFKVAPRLGAILHTSKLNCFYSIEPSEYDILIYMDCDTVVRKPLDNIADPIRNNRNQFLCRRGGLTDRNRFVDFDKLVSRFCGKAANNKVLYQNQSEWPMFNSGIFVASSEAVNQIRRDAVEFSYILYNQWQRIDALESLLPLKCLYKLKLIPSRQQILESWPIEQGALALSCIKAGIAVGYLEERYNSWGNLDFNILHCFKSAYKFDRETMFADNSKSWLDLYSKSELLGKVFLAETIIKFKNEISI